MLVNLARDNPQRPPDWRWLKASKYVEASRIMPRSHRDRLIWEAVEFQQRLRTLPPDEEEAEFEIVGLHSDFPLVAAAYDTYNNSGSTGFRWEIEARILAQEPFESIALKCATPPEVIGVYEQLFFNVLDRLQARTWILNYAIGRSIHVGMTERDYDLLWKLYGYMAGPFFIDILTNKTGIYEDVKPKSIPEALSVMRDAVETSSGVVTSKSFTLTPINSFTIPGLIAIEQGYRQITKESAGVAAAQMWLQQAGAIMSSLPHCSGNDKINQPVLNALRDKYDITPAELRAHEAILVANGETLVGIENERLPEPEAKDGNE
jgi:hypothetical protein